MHGLVGRRPPDRGRLDPGPVARPRRDRRRAGSRSRPGAGDRRPRRWRVRLQGHDAWRTRSSPRSPRVPSTGRCVACWPGARCPPWWATGPRRSSASASAPTPTGGSSPSATTWSSRRRRIKEFAEQTAVATRHMYAAPQPPDDPSARPPRRADAGVDARAGGVPGHVRPRVGDRRARDGARHRPGRAPDPQRADGRPRERASLLQPEPRGLPPRRRGALRLGRARPDPAAASAGGSGGSVPAWRPACTRPARRRHAPASRSTSVIATPSRSTPATSAPAPAPRCCSRRRRRSPWRRPTSRSASATPTSARP